eukprot:TRINITY_DN41651_c0_g1_i1.p1 TRINITY_DN41651_c0_g1~~TRINITY_DN41651_c0_g1_i1.p1  ORF type:complete len:294 (+),score=77.87 TRINITY_DN41651_c0_g1_i1:113-994(+)
MPILPGPVGRKQKRYHSRTNPALWGNAATAAVHSPSEKKENKKRGETPRGNDSLFLESSHQTSMCSGGLPPLLQASGGSLPVGAGCKDGCCWHWLTAMLLQELQTLRKAIAENREANAELERAFVGLESLGQSANYEELVDKHQLLSQTHSSLSSECFECERTNIQLQKTVEMQRAAVETEKAEVRKLEAHLASQAESIAVLLNRQAEATKELERINQATKPLTLQRDEAVGRVNQLKEKLQSVLAETETLKFQQVLLSPKGKEEKANAKAAARRGGTSPGSGRRGSGKALEP